MERMAQPVVRLDSAVAGTLVPRPLYEAGPAFVSARHSRACVLLRVSFPGPSIV